MRFEEFNRMEAGTSWATATSPTSKMMVANSISRRLKPRWLLRRFVNVVRIYDLSVGASQTNRFASKGRRQERSRSVWRPKEAKPPPDSRSPDRSSCQDTTHRPLKELQRRGHQM